LVVQAASGLMSITGPPDGPPMKVGVAVADLFTALYAAIGIQAALLERARTGRGRRVGVSLMDAQVSVLANQALNWLVGQERPVRAGNDHPNVAPYGVFATASDPIVIAVGTDAQFGLLAAAVGCPHWIETAVFGTNAARNRNRAALSRALETALQSGPSEEWLRRFEAQGIPCGPVRDIPEVFDDPAVRARQVRDVAHSRSGTVPQVLSPIAFDCDLPEVRLAPPELGQDTDDVIAHIQRRVAARNRATVR
jgi:crotonobetainyl-CoA:carnitine CoA-transferase CaiB-like acyl-CoA transferase